MIQCRKCGPKPEEEFDWKVKGVRRCSYCKPCQREYQSSWYQRNREKQIKYARNKRNAQIKVNRAFVDEYLSKHPCVDCGESDRVVLEFDHVRGSKKDNISRITLNGWSLDSLIKEISKCEIRCANCHRRVTHARRKHARLA